MLENVNISDYLLGYAERDNIQYISVGSTINRAAINDTKIDLNDFEIELNDEDKPDIKYPRPIIISNIIREYLERKE